MPEGPSGFVVADTVNLFGLKHTDQQFLLCDNYTTLTDIVPNGILGMATVNSSDISATATSFYWHLYYSGQLESPEFSFFMNPGHESGGELTLGGVNKERFEGPITTVALNLNESVAFQRFIMDQSAVYIDNKAVNNSTTGKPLTPAVVGLDTGTAYIQPPDLQTTQDLYAAISTEIKPVGKLGSWGARCAVLDSIAANVTFRWGPGGEFNITLPKDSFNLGPFPGQEEECEAVFVSPLKPFKTPDGKGLWLIGSPLLKNYYTIWDGLNYTMGFARPSRL